MLLLEAALEDELVVAVDGRARRAQLGRQEGQQVLRLPVKPASNLNYFDDHILRLQIGWNPQRQRWACRETAIEGNNQLTLKGRFQQKQIENMLDISPEHVLDVLLLEAALEDELVVAVDGRARRAQFGRQEGQKVLR